MKMITGRFYYYENKSVEDSVCESAENYYEVCAAWPNFALVSSESLGEALAIKANPYEILVEPSAMVSRGIIWVGIGR